MNNNLLFNDKNSLPRCSTTVEWCSTTNSLSSLLLTLGFRSPFPPLDPDKSSGIQRKRSYGRSDPLVSPCGLPYRILQERSRKAQFPVILPRHVHTNMFHPEQPSVFKSCLFVFVFCVVSVFFKFLKLFSGLLPRLFFTLASYYGGNGCRLYHLLWTEGRFHNVFYTFSPWTRSWQVFTIWSVSVTMVWVVSMFMCRSPFSISKKLTQT